MPFQEKSAVFTGRHLRRAACRANRIVAGDSIAFATVLWHRRYIETHSPEIETIAQRGRCDLHWLTGDEIPFVQDGLRDGEHIRHEMQDWVEQALTSQPVPSQILRGSHDIRMRLAMEAARSQLKNSQWCP